MKSIIDRHAAAGITYQGFYSDEMHIQFDWNLGVHFGMNGDYNPVSHAEYGQKVCCALWQGI